MSHKKETAINQGMLMSKKTWKSHWFWVIRKWLNDAMMDCLPLNECMNNEFQAKVVWIPSKLTKRQYKNVNLAIMVNEESRDYSRLSMPNAGLLSTRPLDSFVYPLSFHIGGTHSRGHDDGDCFFKLSILNILEF